MNIILANPRGFCAGVDRAIEIVESALEMFGPPIYVKHEVVHNKYVVDNLIAKGTIFIEDIAEVPEDATLIFSAHGVSQAIRQEAEAKQLTVFDATCPLVTKVHMEVARHSKNNRECILIGHAGHPEVEGTLGQYQNPDCGIYLVETTADVEALKVNDPSNLAFVTQTTLSVDDTNQIITALQTKFPEISGPKREDICYATQNRQDAVKSLSAQTDIVIVVGSPSSSNSNRLRELAEKNGVPAYLIDSSDELQKEWFKDVKNIGITAGASAPEVLVQGVIKQLETWGATMKEQLKGIEETITFSLPKALRKPKVVS